MVLQIIINILVSFSLIAMFAISFTIIFSTSKFFNLTHGIIFTLSGYFAYFFIKQLFFPIGLSMLLGILSSTMFGVLTYSLVFKHLIKRKSNQFTQLIASLGLYVILQNLISIFWGDNTKSLNSGLVKTGNKIFDAYISNVQIIIFSVSILIIVLYFILLNKTSIGKKMRAVSANSNLSSIYGININRIILFSFLIGSFIASVSGVLSAFDTELIPTMGFNLLLYGIVAMIIGGIDSYFGVLGGALILSIIQQLSAYFFGTIWIDALSYSILIVFLIWKPLGLSGKRLKKVEV